MRNQPLDLDLYDDHLRVLRSHRDTGFSMVSTKVLAGAVQVAEALRAEVGRLLDERAGGGQGSTDGLA